MLQLESQLVRVRCRVRVGITIRDRDTTKMQKFFGISKISLNQNCNPNCEH